MDEDIIRKVIDGEIEEFRHLIRKYQRVSFNLARSIIKSDLTAEEAVQDAFVRAFQNLHKFRKKSSFSTWLYKIVLNESLKKINNQAFGSKITELPPGSAEIPSIDPEAIEHLHREEQKEVINQVLDSLKPSESLVLKLFYLEEKKLQEIKEITGFSLANIKVLLHRARKNFYDIYTEVTRVKH